MTTAFTSHVDALNHEYERLHTAKEDAFWAAYMGNTDDPSAARQELVKKEQELKRFLSDPERLKSTRKLFQDADRAQHAQRSPSKPTAAELVALKGWVRTFEAHTIESASARALGETIVEHEGSLAKARGSMRTGYIDPTKGFVPATSTKLGVLISTDRDERLRRAAFAGMRAIEFCVLENGFLDLVKMRNRFGRMLGGEDFYDATVRRVEGMSKAEIFEMLDELEAKTRTAAKRAVDELERKTGSSRVTPWNIRYLIAGDLSREIDPYFPFSKSVERWGRAFASLGVDYNGASLVLDLVDRKGKYENGFMHGPKPAWRDKGEYRPARIQFTANAIPGMVGSGRRATETLFHEGGHAAHFANNDMPAPCFSQEFAPSSVAFAETQSMFMDSMLGDADWRMRYARTKHGDPMPFSLIERAIREDQPFDAWNIRAMLAVCYGEKAIYEMPESDLTAENVLATLRDVERRLLFLDQGSPRPILAIPHLLAGESSAYYHGYVLAEMAVEQTRDHFLGRDGHLVDNPRIGPELKKHYWTDGNAMRFSDFVKRLTGKAPSARALAKRANRTAEAALADARESIERLRSVPNGVESTADVKLNAAIRIAHGRETISEATDFAALSTEFERWIEAREQEKS